MHALFLTTRANRPSHRFRVEQVLPYWTAAGHTHSVQVLARSSWARLWSYRRWSNYDVVFVQQRTFSPLELFWLRKHVKRLIFDLDDAVMFNSDGSEDRRRWDRFVAMLQAADGVICGNARLAELCAAARSPVTVIPTAIDTERFHPRARIQRDDLSTVNQPLTIGWTGSSSTVPYLKEILPVLGRLPADRVRVKFIADTLDGLDLSPLNAVPFEFVKWTPTNEVPETARFDIGLMPVPDNRYTQGKCGCKALQYMALGIPAVVSPVGVNCEFVQEGVNGFLAGTADDWWSALNRLLNDEPLRLRIGSAGRRTVEDRYALRTQGQRVVEWLAGTSKAA